MEFYNGLLCDDIYKIARGLLLIDMLILLLDKTQNRFSKIIRQENEIN